MARPLLFLDFDGVLNTHEYSVSHPVRTLDPVKVKLVEDIVNETDSRIVISSAWRSPKGLTAELVSVLDRAGLTQARERIVGVTPYIPTGTRGDEIGCFMGMSRPLMAHTNNICILDDRDDMGLLIPFLVQTDANVGLTEDDAKRATQMLRGNIITIRTLPTILGVPLISGVRIDQAR